MTISPDEARERVNRLISRYQSLTPAQVKQYNEENTKKDFVLPLFEALGWEIYDSQEVAAEEKASGGRVDYAFKLHGVAQLYLEVKPLRADLNRGEYIKQVVTYAYNKGITWAALTDFEELRLFNAQTGRPCLNLSWQSYISSFDDLWLLSRESLEKNALNEWGRKYGHLSPALAVEQRLFAQLRAWREELFTQLHLHNPQLTFEQIDEVILRFFNRLIFIRTTEDRGLEEHPLRAALNQWHSRGRKGELIQELGRIFQYYDGYYDSDLFRHHLVDQVFIEGDTLGRIIEGLYQPTGLLASYDFSIIDADVLGAVYEQYLGHVAVIAKKRAQQAQARMELVGLPGETVFELEAKKQRRKEMGIYYTPKWVVDYIVGQTVGRFLKERSHHDILNIKILDPACGSGSFLIRAYDALLSYHAQAKGKSAAELDQFDRLPILTRNIFGVDLDTQAVEIAHLNLLIRSLARREILPSLADNVRQGNSLVSGSEAELTPYFGDGWRDKKPFNWEQEFRDVMSNGGFDVVIGNPPYVRIQSLPRDEADYFREHYESAYGSFDIYVLFLEKAVRLLKPGGRLGFICSGKFLKSQYGKNIQELLRRDCTVEDVIDLSAHKVFAEATTYPAIVVVGKMAGDNPLCYVSVPEKIADSISVAQLKALPAIITKQEAITGGLWPPPPAQGDPLLEKLSAQSEPLGELAERIFQGLVTSADKIYILEKRGEPVAGKIKVYSRSLDKIIELECAPLKPLLMGKDIKRFTCPAPAQMLLFPYKVKGDTAELIPVDQFSSLYPKCWQYLVENRETLENRENGKMKHEKWYAYVYPKSLAMHDKPKILTGVLADKSRFAIDKDGIFYFMGGGNAGGYGVILKNKAPENYLYMLGLLNSSLLDFSLKKISSPFRGGFFSYARRYIEKLPIRRIDFANPVDKKLHDDLVTLVESMLELQKRLAPLRNTPWSERDELQHQIKLTDREIDSLVYDLYGLTDEERRIVEDSFKQR